MGFSPQWAEVAERRGLIAEPVPIAAPALDCSEKELQAKVVRLLKRNGWEHYHPYDSRKSNEGYPDLTCWRERVLWIECKKEDGVVSKDQECVIAELRAAGQEVYVVRPSGWVALLEILK